MNEEIATEGMRREKLEELIDRMHAFQNTEIESSNALKLELKAQKDAVSRPAKPTFMYLATHSRFRLHRGMYLATRSRFADSVSIVASVAPGP